MPLIIFVSCNLIYFTRGDTEAVVVTPPPLSSNVSITFTRLACSILSLKSINFTGKKKKKVFESTDSKKIKKITIKDV